ncbi:hypothetical protein ACB371_06680, partial [Klebsiella pneumoniae]
FMSYFVQLLQADINRFQQDAFSGFRIYRETLSRFSCAASTMNNAHMLFLLFPSSGLLAGQTASFL